MFISTISEIAKANKALCFSNVVSSWGENDFSIMEKQPKAEVSFLISLCSNIS